MHNLSITEILMVRACKARCNTLRRLRTIYTRSRAVRRDYPCDPMIADHLTVILEKQKDGFKGRHWNLVIGQLAPDQAWKVECDENTPYWERVIAVLSSHIKFTTPDKAWSNYRAPSLFTNPESEWRRKS